MTISEVDFALPVFDDEDTGAQKNRLLCSNQAVWRIHLTSIGHAMIGLNARNVH